MQPGGFIVHQASQLDLGRHIGEFELDGLEFADRLSKLLAFLRICEGFIQTGLRQTNGKRRDSNTPTIKNLHELLEAIAALAKHVAFRHHAIFKAEWTSIRGLD